MVITVQSTSPDTDHCPRCGQIWGKAPSIYYGCVCDDDECALMSKCNQQAAEIERLRAALQQIRSLAHFEPEQPTGLFMTCLSLIEKETLILDESGVEQTHDKP